MPSFSDNDGDMDYVNNGGSENIDFNCSCKFFELTKSPVHGSGGVNSISPANFTFNFTSEDIDADRQVDLICYYVFFLG